MFTSRLYFHHFLLYPGPWRKYYINFSPIKPVSVPWAGTKRKRRVWEKGWRDKEKQKWKERRQVPQEQASVLMGSTNLNVPSPLSKSLNPQQTNGHLLFSSVFLLYLIFPRRKDRAFWLQVHFCQSVFGYLKTFNNLHFVWPMGWIVH